MISRIYKEKITPIAHVKILEVAGRTDMCYLDDFLIKKVLEIHSISTVRCYYYIVFEKSIFEQILSNSGTRSRKIGVSPKNRGLR